MADDADTGQTAETQTPLQRAASVIEHEFIELADPYGAVSSYGIAHRVVRAVLEAIREPSKGMIEAGSIASFDVEREERAVDGAETAGVYQAMIDAALEEI